jgi:hypothetical protein
VPEKYIPDFKYELFDISQMPDEQIKGTPLLRIVLLTMKYIKSKNLETKLDDILVIFKELSPDSEDTQFWQVLANYVDNAARPDKRRQCARKIFDWFESGDQKMPGVFDELKKKYQTEDRLLLAQGMLDRNMSVEIIHELTSLSKRRIIQLKTDIKKNGEQKIPNVFEELEQQITIKIANKMLAEGMDTGKIHKITDLPLALITELQKRIRNAGNA